MNRFNANTKILDSLCVYLYLLLSINQCRKNAIKMNQIQCNKLLSIILLSTFSEYFQKFDVLITQNFLTNQITWFYEIEKLFVTTGKTCCLNFDIKLKFYTCTCLFWHIVSISGIFPVEYIEVF